MCFVVSTLIKVARHTRGFKLGSKPGFMPTRYPTTKAPANSA